MNAAELDRYLAAKDAYDTAIRQGWAEEQARELAGKAVAIKVAKQRKERYGLPDLEGMAGDSLSHYRGDK